VHLVGFTVEIYYDAWPYEHQNSQHLTENLLGCLQEPLFRCNGEDGHFNPQTYSPFVVFTLCAARPTPIFLCLRNVLSDSLLHSFYLHYDLPNLLPIPFIYSMRCHTQPPFLACTLCAVRLTPNIFYLHYALYNSSSFYIYVVGCC
jgi:hypothetical protein